MNFWTWIAAASSLRWPEKCEVRDCVIGGHSKYGIQFDRGDSHKSIGNCIVDMGGDDFRLGSSASNLQMLNNWGARRRRIYDPGGGNHDHNDFFQCYSGGGGSLVNLIFRGNIHMPLTCTDRPGTPMQFMQAGQNPLSDARIEENILITNTFASQLTGNGASGNLVEFNTVLRSSDLESNIKYTSFNVSGVSSLARNFQCNWNQDASAAQQGLQVDPGST